MNTYVHLSAGQIIKVVHSDTYPPMTEGCWACDEIVMLDGAIDDLGIIQAALDVYLKEKWWAKEQI